MNTPTLLDAIALTAALPAEHAQTGAALTLLPGQVGTVVLTLGNVCPDGSHPAYEVEFVDARDGHTYAVATVPAEALVALRRRDPVAAAA